MKYLLSFLTILFTFTLNAQWSFNSTSGSSGNGIESPNNTASGNKSIAMGNITTASGDFSTSMGQGTIASGYYSTTMGVNTTASGWTSIATGNNTTASDEGTFAIGFFNTDDASPNPTTFDMANRAFIIGNGTNTSNKSDALTVLFDGTTTIAGSVTAKSFISEGSEASGSNSTALGFNTTASASYSTALGTYTTASGTASTAIGEQTSASGSVSTAMGAFTNASGDFSTATGFFTTAEDHCTFIIGRLNTDDPTPNPDSFSLANRAFVIGNGTDEYSRSDAMTVLFDGTTTIAGDLNLYSDARLKSNIISLGNTLNRVLLLDGKNYTLKTDESKQKIGLIAQDVQEVFPELVTESQDEQGTLSVNYQGLIPVLINAIKEQQKEIEDLKSQVRGLQ